MATAANIHTRVLVTGASGYLGTHCVQQLLEQGYQVRGTVRDLTNQVKIEPLKQLKGPGQLELVEADLENADDWPKAVADCRFVLHVASPFPIVADAGVLKTAIEGTLNVLRAVSHCPQVQKVVLTSSCAAINEGHGKEERVFTEEDWTNLDDPQLSNYVRSKTLAEKAAWDFWNGLDENTRFQLTVLNPTLIVGPLLMDVQGASVTIIRRFMNKEMPMVPHMQMGLVDVRDVARAHVLAMTADRTNGRRILITSDPALWFLEIAQILAREFGSQGYYISTMQAPYVILWLYSRFDVEARSTLQRVDWPVKFDNTQAKELLGIEFSNPAQSLVDMAYSMIERGILPKKAKYKGLPSSNITH